MTRTLDAEEKGLPAEGTRISGEAGGGALSQSEIGITAAAHGKELMELGFSGATAVENRVLIEVEDRCGGLRPASIERMFRPFSERKDETTGLGLGLSIARQSVEAEGGVLSVRNLPGVGCVFTMDLPSRSVGRSEEA